MDAGIVEIGKFADLVGWKDIGLSELRWFYKVPAEVRKKREKGR